MIRSDSLTMPTTLFSSSTTGIAPRSVFASRSMAVRASSSGRTLGTSRSMISPAFFMAARLFDRAVRAYCQRDRVDHVAGDHRLHVAHPGGGVAAGAGVGKDRGAGGGEGLEAAGQECRSHSGEDVTAAGGGEGRGRERVDGDPGAVGADRVVALEDDDRT